MQRVTRALRAMHAELDPSSAYFKVPSRKFPPRAAHTAKERWFTDPHVASQALPSSPSDRVDLLTTTAPVEAGQALVCVELAPKCLQTEATWGTLQVAEGLCAHFGGKILKFNHSSNPNVELKYDGTAGVASDASVTFVAARDIPIGEVLCFDYNRTEWKMSGPFLDWATNQEVAGFLHLSSGEKERLVKNGLVAPHIGRMWESVSRVESRVE
jgi:hypothetical protein